MFTGQLISDDISEVLSRVNNLYITPYGNQLSTTEGSPLFDDSYLGKRTASGLPLCFFGRVMQYNAWLKGYFWSFFFHNLLEKVILLSFSGYSLAVGDFDGDGQDGRS